MHGFGLILILFEHPYGTASLWLWPNRTYVGSIVFLILKVLFPGVACTNYDTIAFAHPCAVLIHYNGDNTLHVLRFRIDFDLYFG